MVRLGANPQDQNKGATFLSSIQFSRFYLFFHVGHGGPIYCFTYGPVGIFSPLSSYSSAWGLFQAYKKTFLSMYLLSTYLLVLQF